MVVCKSEMLRIHSGTLKGRKLSVPKGIRVRPTTARIKQSVFDSLNDFEGKTVLDCFAGSGALGIESLSRGASECTFIEKNNDIVKLITRNLQSCSISKNYKIMDIDYNKALNILRKKRTTFDYIFIDPPFELYEKIDVEILISDFTSLLNKYGTIVIEHTRPVKSLSDNLLISEKKYGSNYVSFIRYKIQGN